MWRVCVIKKPRKNEEAKALLPGCENTTTMGCNVRKTNRQTNCNVSSRQVRTDYSAMNQRRLFFFFGVR